MKPPRNPIRMAVVGAAHGIKGEVRVKSFTGDPLALAEYGPLWSEDGRAFEIADIRMQGDMAVVRIKGVADRSAAEALTHTALFVDRDRLPVDLDDEEYYHTDLIGLEAVEADGEAVGKVVGVHDFGGGDILEISRGKGTVLVPFSKAAVPTIDFVARKLVIDAAAAGLVDSDDDDATPGDVPPAVRKRPRGPKSAGGNR